MDRENAGRNSAGSAAGEPAALIAPTADRFPAFSVGWHLFGTSRELRRGPVSRDLLGRRLVCYRGASGKLVMLDARCAHLGADLGLGRTVGDGIECPFHNWVFGADGACAAIPAGGEIPCTARQATYPVRERHGLVFVFARPNAEPLYELPFFPEVDPTDVVPARPFSTVLRCPWYMVGANGFDGQHFRAAHDRRMVSSTGASTPTPFARAGAATFEIDGTSFRDRLTKLAGGARVTLSIFDYGGCLIFVTSTLRRTRSYGMVCVTPLPPDARGCPQSRVTVTVFARRSQSAAGRLALDGPSAAVRRSFIRAFLRSDAERLEGVSYNPRGLVEADREMAEYFRWLAHVSHGTPWPTGGGPVADRQGGAT